MRADGFLRHRGLILVTAGGAVAEGGILALLAAPGSRDPDVPPERAGRRGPPPRLSRAFWSCLALTAVCWVLLSPAVTLAFGAAVLRARLRAAAEVITSAATAWRMPDVSPACP